jgi:hypothetical protein
MIMPGGRGANAASALIKSQWLSKELTVGNSGMRPEMLSSRRFRSVQGI